jgi:tetratricopeptide (TPR) repeat protein
MNEVTDVKQLGTKWSLTFHACISEGKKNTLRPRNFFLQEGKMKSRRLMTVALVSSLVVASVSLPARAADSDQDAIRAKARAELAVVTIDVDKADIAYSPADNGVGPNYTAVQRYQQEYLAGRESFQDGKYRDALKHLRKADEIIRSQPDWAQSE